MLEQTDFQTAADESQEEDVACPSCKQPLPAGSILCTHCGYHFKLKKHLKSSFVTTKEKRVKRVSVKAEPSNRLASVAFSDVLLAPFDVETVIAETIVLVAWAVLWSGLFFFFFAALVFLQFSIFAVFTVSSAIAGILRFWMAANDVSIRWLFTFLGVVAGVSVVGAWLIDRSLPPGPDERPGILFFIVFLGTLFFVLWLRMLSFFLGRYFAICRRSALGAMMSEDDQGGLIDLGYAIVVLFVSLTPLLTIGLAWRHILIHRGAALASPESLALGILFAISLLWCHFYFPIASGVVALTRSLSPSKAITWAGKCMPDYLAYLILLFPFYVAVAGLALLLAAALTAVQIMAGVPQFLVECIYFFIANIVLTQYLNVSSFHALGLVLRRHESRIGWLSTLESR